MRPLLAASINCLALSMASVLLGQAAEKEEQATIRLKNRDYLTGTLKALNSTSLVWESKAAAEPATFELENVIDVTLPGEYKQPKSSHVATLTLMSGDEIRGLLNSITKDEIIIETGFAGKMKFQRAMVSKIEIHEGGKAHYRGPISLQGWHQTPEESWKYKDLSFISNKAGSIACDNILPEECTISFTMERKNDNFDLKLMIFSDDIESSRPRSGYELSFQRSSIYLRSGKTRNFLGSDHARELSENDKARIEIRASRKTGKIVLLINGKISEVWMDPNAKDNNFGSGLHYLSGSEGSYRITNIQIDPWDGVVENLPPPLINRINPDIENSQDQIEQSPEKTNDGAKLDDSAVIEGKITAVEDGIITLKTSQGEIKIPAERLNKLQGLNTERAKRQHGDIRIHFADGSKLVCHMQAATEKHLAGTSQNFGTANFDLSAINRIEFNIYNEKLKSLHSNKDW